MPANLSIRKTSVGGLDGLILENRRVRVVVTPEFGARIISMIYKPTETEFAWHSPNVPIRKPTYQLEFEDTSGLFDCVPTTEPCTFKGRKLPAAGEVSSEPWRVLRIEKHRKSIGVIMECACKVYPLSIRKRISMNDDESVLRLHYTLRNLSDERLEYHYSGHNTLRVTPYHRIFLPREVSRLKLGYAVTDRLGRLGDEISWPETVDKNGKTIDLSKLGNPCDGVAENLYTPRVRETWCGAVNEARGEAIAFSWSGEVLPYILVWINCGGWRDYYHIALEPLTGRPDNLDVAVNQWKEYAALEARQRVEWDERIILAHGVQTIERVEDDQILGR